MDHKYFLDEHLRGEALELKVDSWFDPGQAKEFLSSNALRTKTISNLEDSKKTLSDRLRLGSYSTTFAERLKAKLPQFHAWIEHIKDQ